MSLLAPTTDATARVVIPAALNFRTTSRRTSTPRRCGALPNRSETYSPTERYPSAVEQCLGVALPVGGLVVWELVEEGLDDGAQLGLKGEREALDHQGPCAHIALCRHE